MAVKPEIDNVTDAQGVDIRELRFGRLAGGCYPIIKPPPVINGFRVGHKILTMANAHWRTATGNSADRSRHFSTDVVTPSLKRTGDLRSNPSRQARELFKLGLVHALEYGVASADPKPSTPWTRSRFP